MPSFKPGKKLKLVVLKVWSLPAVNVLEMQILGVLPRTLIQNFRDWSPRFSVFYILIKKPTYLEFPGAEQEYKDISVFIIACITLEIKIKSYETYLLIFAQKSHSLLKIVHETYSYISWNKSVHFRKRLVFISIECHNVRFEAQNSPLCRLYMG